MTLADLKTAIAESRAAYQAIVHTGTAEQVRAVSQAVKAAQKALSDAIAEGALPCPRCKVPPVGIEQPRGGRAGGVEYQVGCPGCGASQRGGLLPKHTVEIWNASLPKAEESSAPEAAS